jgi:hypothetical protein
MVHNSVCTNPCEIQKIEVCKSVTSQEATIDSGNSIDSEKKKKKTSGTGPYSQYLFYYVGSGCNNVYQQPSLIVLSILHE